MRYNEHSGTGTGSGSDNEYDDTTLKLQPYAAVRLTPTGLNYSEHSKYGDSFISNYDDGVVLDGIVFQRDDKPGTWKVLGFGEMGFEVDDTGAVYEGYDADEDEYTGKMSAEEVLDHARVQGFSETFGGDKYWYTPVGVVIEGHQDVAVNDEVVDSEEVEDAEIPIGETSLMLGNKSWARTLAKLVTDVGADIIATEEDEDGNETAVKDDHGWLTTDDYELREGLEGRPIELFVIEESFVPEGEDEEVQYNTPVLLDAKTGARITLDNDVSESGEPELEEDSESDSEDESEEDSESTSEDEPEEGAEDESESDSDFDPSVDELIDYFAKTKGEAEPDVIRDFADEDEIDDLDEVDWEAASEEVTARA